jgi:hypothetical protein
MQQLRFYSPQWLYSTCFGRQSHPSSGVHMLYMATCYTKNQKSHTVYSVQCIVDSVQCIVDSVQCIVYSGQCTAYSVQWTPVGGR